MHTPFRGDYCWGVQIQKNEVTIKKKKFFIGDSIEALIQFKKEHHGSLKLHVPLGGRSFL